MMNKRYLIPFLLSLPFFNFTYAFADTCKLNATCSIRVQHPSDNAWLEPVLTASDTILLGEKVKITDQQQKPGKVAGVNKDVNLGKTTQTGGIYAAENISLADGSVVAGDLVAKKVLRAPKSVAPTKFSWPGLPTSSLWKTSFKSKNTTSIDVKSLTVLAPGRYQKISVKPQAKLRLKTGIYYFDSLETNQNSEIILENKNGTVLIYVRDQITHAGRFVAKPSLSDVVVVYFGSKPINLLSEFDGSLVAPLADVTIHAVAGATHDGIFYAKKILVQDSAIIRGLSPTRKGPILAELKNALKSETIKDYAEGDALPAKEPAGFSDTATGKLLANHLKDMYGYGPNAEAQYQANLELLRKDAKAAVNELNSLYEKTPSTLSNQEMKWNLVQIMGDLKSPEAFEPLRNISQSPINTVDTSAYKSAHGESIDGQKWEQMIRSRAVDGLTQLAKSGHPGANEALLQIATSTTDARQRYAITGYLDAGSDYQSRVSDLQKVLPKDQQHLLSMTQDISKVEQGIPAEVQKAEVNGASTPVR